MPTSRSAAGKGSRPASPAANWRPVRIAHRRTDQQPQLVEIDRLGQVIEGARLQRGHGVLGAAVGGDHGDRRAGRLRDFAYQLKAGAVRQAHVGQAQRVPVAREQRTRRRYRFRRVHVQPEAQQRERQQLAQIRLVVDDEHRGRAPAHRRSRGFGTLGFAHRTGIVSRNPCRLASTRAPCPKRNRNPSRVLPSTSRRAA